MSNVHGNQSATIAIQTMKLSKRYAKGKPLALNSVDLSVYRGEIFGYLGPNGAGKTTTIRLLLDLIRPDSGSAHVLGMDANAQSVEIRRRIGFLPGELNLWDGLTGKQVLRYLGDLRGGVDPRYVNELVERLGFDASKTVRSYSSGNRRKLGLILALMHRPELLILDEPTNGLDPLVQQTFHELMREARADGRTVFLSSHILTEVQQLCDRVAILRDGQIRATERVADLVRVNFHWVTLLFREPVSVHMLAGVPGVSDVSIANGPDNALRFRLTGDFDPVLRAVNDQYLISVHTEDPTLEEVFLTYYGNGKNSHATAPARESVNMKEKEAAR
ncbi:MAG: ABC transporter ATP-binding protein [Anaerolineae bacterium]|nr:ABC transporter ATP-binding protein [Anaerolineae bacterium]